MSMPSTHNTLDAVDAYDRIAPSFGGIRAARQAYCDGIDRLIMESLPTGARSLLDVGCGDGTRARAIAEYCGLTDVVLLEPSSGMRKLIAPGKSVWSSRIEDVDRCDRKFDVITCLWNVLGHLPSRARRLLALQNMRSLLAPRGAIFLDVHHRYNASEYGVFKTAARFAFDALRPSPSNGDVTVRWTAAGETISTTGHFFTQKEMLALFRDADLTVQQMHVVDYATGHLRPSVFSGNLLFVTTASLSPTSSEG